MNRKPAEQDLDLHTNMIEAHSKVTPSEMKETQQSGPSISQLVQYVKAGKKPKLSQIRK